MSGLLLPLLLFVTAICLAAAPSVASPMFMGLGAVGSVAFDVSGDGRTVVGHIPKTGEDPGDIREAIRWTLEEGVVRLGDFAGGDFNSIATAASFDGSVIVGFGNTDTGPIAFRWTSSTDMVALTNPAGTVRNRAEG